MYFDLASAMLAVALVLAFWLTPLLAYLLSTRARGLEKFNWALLIAALSWPGYAVYLLCTGVKQNRS